MVTGEYARMAEAIRFLEQNAPTQPNLTDLSTHLGLSKHHLHRVFHRWVGVTPKDFLQALTLCKAKSLLACHAPSLLDVSLSVGLSGTSRLHDLFVTQEGMTPGDFKNRGSGVTITWGLFETALGFTVIAKTHRGVCGLFFQEDSHLDSALKELQRRWPAANFAHDNLKIGPIANEICARMQGKLSSPLPLALMGSPFQLKVWQALLEVPEGQVVTYKRLAQAAGHPEAVRAVGTAMGANPIGYLIPCHRVIKSTGAIGEYRWGADRKTILLASEISRNLKS